MLTNSEIKRQMALGNISISDLKSGALDKPNSCKVSLSDELYSFDYSIVEARGNAFYNNGDFSEQPTLRKVRIPKTGLLLEPRKVYLAKTAESIKTNGYIPVLNGRTSLSLLGVSIELTSGYAQDKFDGQFLLSIICTKPTIIYPDIEVGNLTFFKSLSEKDEEIGMLSGEEIKRRFTTGEIVITPQDHIVINPNSVNLSLNKNMGYYVDPVLDLNKRNKVEYFTIAESGTILYPDKIYLARSNEWTETSNLVPMMSGRSSLGRLGYHAHCSAGMGSIGYKGYWHMGIRPTMPIRVYENMKTCQIYYFTVEGEISDTYSGSMQNVEENDLGSQYHKTLSKKYPN